MKSGLHSYISRRSFSSARSVQNASPTHEPPGRFILLPNLELMRVLQISFAKKEERLKQSIQMCLLPDHDDYNKKEIDMFNTYDL
jgi:hypothetical protein